GRDRSPCRKRRNARPYRALGRTKGRRNGSRNVGRGAGHPGCFQGSGLNLANGKRARRKAGYGMKARPLVLFIIAVALFVWFETKDSVPLQSADLQSSWTQAEALPSSTANSAG